MLDFMGMALDQQTDPTSIILRLHPDPETRNRQLSNLAYSHHNYLRITRMLRSLVELGQPDFVPSFLLFIAAQQAMGVLNNWSLKDSMDRFWVYCMRDQDAQHAVVRAVKWVRGNGDFPMAMYRRVVEEWKTTGKWKFDEKELGLKKIQRSILDRVLTRRPRRSFEESER